MVLPRCIAAFVATLAIPAMAAIPPAQVVINIKTVTKMSMDLQGPASQVSAQNAYQLSFGSGPWAESIKGFSGIIATVTQALSDMQGDAVVPAGADSDAIFNAFRDFVYVHQVLLNIFIGKSGVLTSVPFVGPPFTAALRGIEKVVDTVAFALIDGVQGHTVDFQYQAGALNGTIQEAICRYSSLGAGGAGCKTAMVLPAPPQGIMTGSGNGSAVVAAAPPAVAPVSPVPVAGPPSMPANNGQCKWVYTCM